MPTSTKQLLSTGLTPRKQAAERGLLQYFTGKPCKNGHVAPRLVSNRGCMVCFRERANARYKSDPEPVRERSRQWRAANPDEARATTRRWYSNNREAYLESIKETRRQQQPQRQERQRNNPALVFTKRLRTRLYIAIRDRNAVKAASTLDLVGCTSAELCSYIESRFLPGMDWGNRSDWHIDHILPCSAFDMLDPLHQRACFHYTNLQPLWRSGNISKGDKHNPAEVAAWVARFEEPQP